jgi:acetyl-CoA synthetase
MSDLYPPKPDIARDAHVRGMEEYDRTYRRSLQDPDGFWAEQAERVDWFARWHRVHDFDYHEVEMSWFAGGKLNAAHNCVDRHLPHRAEQVAIIWARDQEGEYERITYRQLHRQVGRIANALKAHGVRKGDRVCIYLPMIPELAYVMLACARIGAVHSVVFGGFSAESLRDRILDAGAEIVVTANEGLRGGKHLRLKATVDEAVDGLGQVRHVLVARRTETPTPMRPGRDVWLHEAADRERAVCPAEWMDAEDPLFILYTSGSTGKPKGVLHTTGGYLVYAAMTHQLVFDYQPEEIYFCAADIGWITGHSYILYGPLANGATTVMFESIPTYPNAGRYWRIVDDLGVDIFYTAPTAIRAIAREGDEWVKKHRRTSLRVLGTVGEPINPEVWKWYHDVVGEGRAAVVDTWWQTETGGILISPLPGVTSCKPGSATFPLFGIEPVLVDAEGNKLEGNGVSGNLCLARSWPGQARTLYGDHERFKSTYFATHRGYYFTGDGCRRDEDGYYWITGRVGARAGGGGGRRRVPARDQGPGDLRLRPAQSRSGAGGRGGRGDRGRSQGAGAARHRTDRHARPDHDRDRPAQDAQREDHAPHPPEDRGRRVRRSRGRHDAGRSVDRRAARRSPPEDGVIVARADRPVIAMGVLALVVGASGCRLFSSDLGRIVDDPWRFHGQEVTVEGRAEAIRWIPEVGAVGFRIEDGTDSLLVLTQGELPAAGDRVRLEGRVHRSFPVDGEDRVVLVLASRSRPGSGDAR